MSAKRFLTIGLIISLLIAGVASYFASSEPDGLEKVSTDQGLDANSIESVVSGSIFADYGVVGISNSTGLAGIFGVLVTGLLGFGLVKWMTKK
jgi:cobalt/nickel transport protein